MYRHESMDPVVLALAARTDQFVRAPDNPPKSMLGLGYAVFVGGVTLILPTGARETLVAPRSIWTWPVLITSVGLFTAVAVGVIGDSPGLVRLMLVSLLGFVFAAIALGTLLFAIHARRHSLVIDAGRGVCDEISGTRTVLSVPSRLIERVHVSIYASSSYGDYHNVLIDVRFRELWVHQADSLEGALGLAKRIADALQVRFDPEPQRTH